MLTQGNNIDEVIKTVLNSFVQKLHNHKKAQKRKQANKNRKIPLKTSKGKIATYSLICVFVLLPECLYVFMLLVLIVLFSAFCVWEMFS